MLSITVKYPLITIHVLEKRESRIRTSVNSLVRSQRVKLADSESRAQRVFVSRTPYATARRLGSNWSNLELSFLSAPCNARYKTCCCAPADNISRELRKVLTGEVSYGETCAYTSPAFVSRSPASIRVMSTYARHREKSVLPPRRGGESENFRRRVCTYQAGTPLYRGSACGRTGSRFARDLDKAQLMAPGLFPFPSVSRAALPYALLPQRC